jgi:hypothetical protein
MAPSPGSFLSLLLLLASRAARTSRRYTTHLDVPTLVDLRCRRAFSASRHAQILHRLRQRCHVSPQSPQIANQPADLGALVRLILQTCARLWIVRLERKEDGDFLGVLRLRRR